MSVGSEDARRRTDPAERTGNLESLDLDVLHRALGRAILLERDGTVYAGRGYAIHRSSDGGASWEGIAAIPRPTWRRLAEPSRLASRLLRQEIRALARLSDGTLVAACKLGLFHGAGGLLEPSAIAAGNTLLQYPMRLGVGPNDVVAWGEYVAPRKLRPVRIFASRDRGRSFEVVHTFPPGEIVHVHNVIWAPTAGHWWVLSGDHEREPGIGRLSADFTRFEWLVKGEQQFRAVSLFQFGDRLIYATDTERQPNGVIALDTRTGSSERICDLEGSSLYACRFGEFFAVSTTVEPSKVNRSPWATLWLSRDGERWRCAWRARKDRWHPDYFQFGSLILPAGESDESRIWFSGQAVEGLDGRTAAARPHWVDADGRPSGSDA